MSRADNDDSPTHTSAYEPLLPPEEPKSQIPAHLLVDATPQDQHIMHALSIGAQYDQWLVQALVKTHLQVRTTNGKLLRAEADIVSLKDDRRSIVRGWRFIVAVAAGLSGLISFLVMVYQALAGSGH